MMRRVVVGETSTGSSRFISDAPAPDVSIEGPPRWPNHVHIWGADGLTQAADIGSELSYRSYFPPRGGYRIMVLTMLPDATFDMQSGEDGTDWSESPIDEMSRWEQKYPGVHSNTDVNFDPSIAGMHWTETVDVGLILDGRIELEVDDETTLLERGDWFVQNGARHAWRNRSDAPCTMAVFVVGTVDEAE